MSVPPRWACLTIRYIPTEYDVTAVATTDVPCHLWARWSENEPQFHKKSYIIRGQITPWGLRICFTSYQDLEQLEPGDTLTHTFYWDDWVYCITRWFYLYGTIGGLKSPSTSGIFKYHNNFIPPPPEEEIMAELAIPFKTGKQKTSSNITAVITSKTVT